MTLRVYERMEQRSEEWFEARRGIVTASVVGQLITAKTIKTAANLASRALAAQLVAERITGWVEPTYQSHDMLRGVLDEPTARRVYSEHHAPVVECGFMVRDDWGFRIGWSPDGLVGDVGAIEVKSRNARQQVTTVLADAVPDEHMAQCQCALLVSGREWIDYVSFAGGMHMFVKRVEPDEHWQTAILEAVGRFEKTATEMQSDYERAVVGLPMTERTPDYFATEII